MAIHVRNCKARQVPLNQFVCTVCIWQLLPLDDPRGISPPDKPPNPGVGVADGDDVGSAGHRREQREASSVEAEVWMLVAEDNDALLVAELEVTGMICEALELMEAPGADLEAEVLELRDVLC